MGVQMEVKQQESVMIRLVGDKLVKENRVANLYIVPPKDKYKFMITGYAEPFEMPKSEDYGGGTQIMTRVEFTILEGKGNGKMFDQMWGFSIGPKSNFGRFCRLMNIPIPQSGMFDMDETIGYIGEGYVVPGEALGQDGKPKYAKLSLDTVEGVSAPEKTYSFQGEVAGAPAKSNATSNGNGHETTDDGWPQG